MRLLTHNHLACIRKNCPATYPLALEADTVEQEDTDCNAAFIAHTMLHIDYPVLYNTAHALGLSAGLRQPTNLTTPPPLLQPPAPCRRVSAGSNNHSPHLTSTAVVPTTILGIAVSSA